MDFSLNEDQSAIGNLAQQIFSDQASDEALLAHDRSGDTYDASLWELLAQQGLLGLAVPETCGGSGLGVFELTLVLKEQGRHVAPVPLLSNLAMAGLPIAEFGNADQQEKYLGPLALGESQLSAAVADLGMAAAVATEVEAQTEGDGWLLNGHKYAVPYGHLASAILVPVVDGEQRHSIFIVDCDKPGVSLQPEQTMLGEIQATLVLDNVSVTREDLLADIGGGEQILDWIQLRTDTALCALQLGITEEALRRTAEYTSERKQFGVAIGSFQAVGMRAADAFIDIEAIRSTLYQAAWRLAEGMDASIEVRAAKYWAGIGGHRVCHAAMHLHGGIGSDLEYPIHRYFLWSKNNEMSFGSSAMQLDKLGKILASDDDSGTAWLQV